MGKESSHSAWQATPPPACASPSAIPACATYSPHPAEVWLVRGFPPLPPACGWERRRGASRETVWLPIQPAIASQSGSIPRAYESSGCSVDWDRHVTVSGEKKTKGGGVASALGCIGISICLRRLDRPDILPYTRFAALPFGGNLAPFVLPTVLGQKFCTWIDGNMASTLSQPKRHASSLFHHHSSRVSQGQSEEAGQQGQAAQARVFEGTDAITQNRRVALQRILEVHAALVVVERNHHPADTAAPPSPPASERPGSASSTSSTALAPSLGEMTVPDAELRAFRYLVRRWDRRAPADPAFEHAIAATREQFEETATRHFLRRIALWHASDEAKEDVARSVWRRRRERSKSQVDRPEGAAGDQLQEATTQEGLAQLLWTLLHDAAAPLAPGLMAECTEALKRRYGMAC